MRLELYIRGRFYTSAGLTLPEAEDWMDLKNLNDFEVYCSGREEYVNLMIRGFLNKHHRAIENQEWEIRRIFESKMNEVFYDKRISKTSPSKRQRQRFF